MTHPNSMAAFDSIKQVRPTLRQEVYDFLAMRDDYGATDDEVEFVTGMIHQTASARRRELVLDGLVKDSGQRRDTRSGRKATVWVVT